MQTFLIKPVPICSSRRGLSPKQQVLCQTYRDHMEYMIDGGKMALDECQYQFKERRWNCTFPKRHMRGFLTPEMPVGKSSDINIGSKSLAGKFREREMYNRSF